MPTKYKLIIWHVLIVLLALVFWTYMAELIARSSDSLTIEPEGVIFLLALTSVVALGFALFQKRWLVLSFTAAMGLPYVLALPGYLSWAGIAAMVLLLFYSRSATVRELRERSKVNIRAVLGRSLTGAMLAVFVAISFAAYTSPIAEELERSERLPSGIEKFIRTIVESTIGPRIEGSQAEKQTVISQVARETFHELNTFFGPYFKHAPPLLAFTVFLILWGLSWIFIQLSIWVGWAIFVLLKKVKFVEIKEHDAKAEILLA